jgi:DEAD/DEAH box helicase domain-containing protein
MKPPVIDTISQVLDSFSDIVHHYAPDPTGPTPGRFVPITSVPLHDALAAALTTVHRSGFFSHQAKAIERLLAGEHTVVATQTSSGKSLIYSAPVLDAILREPHATALFIYPQKALANDQAEKLRALAASIPQLEATITRTPHFISRYDGATPKEVRATIREQASIVLTNPDMLHMGILQHHHLWARFLSRLKYVIIDECHAYRGVFGANVALLLRRLRQASALHGSSPTIVATSATIREPRVHLENLTGESFTCIGSDDDGSAQGRRRFWMTSGTDHFYDLGRKVALELAKQGLSVLAFCPSRVAAEVLTSRVGEASEPFVRVYRAGISAKDREAIEAGLRDGSVRLVFSTNALELGIDIGALDAVVCIGLPNSMMSLWQRAGRVARAGKEGGVILIPADTPIDSYYASIPEELFNRDNEPLALSLDNKRILHGHVACAIKEAGGDAASLRLDLLGDAVAKVVALREAGALEDDIFYIDEPHSRVNVRSMGENSYELRCDGDRLGDIDDCHLLREAYQSAIYLHGGVAYRVKDVRKRERTIFLNRDFSGNRTTPYIQKQIKLKARRSVKDSPEVGVVLAELDATERILNIVEKNRSGSPVKTIPGSGGTTPHRLPTEGVQLTFKPLLWDRYVNDIGAPQAKAALEACERLIASMFPTISGPCDPQDYSSSSTLRPDGSAVITLYDNVYGGADVTPCAFHHIESLIANAIRRLGDCRCSDDTGCFRCIKNPRTEETSSKQACLSLLNRIHRALAADSLRTSDLDPPTPGGATAEESTCPACHTQQRADARFCDNCGHKLE